MKSLVLCDDGHVEEVVKLCQKYNLGIEIQGFYNPNNVDQKETLIEKYNNVLPSNIEKHLHAPFWELSLGSKNNKIKDVTNYFFDYSYKVAEELGCETVTVHHGYIPKTSNLRGWIKRSIKFWNDFFKEHQGNVVMCMENFLEYTPKAFIEIVDGVNSNKLGVNLDIGHVNCNSKTPSTEWIRQLGDRIKYVHIHDNFGENDDHLGLGKGSMNIVEILNDLNTYAPNATWALECKIDHLEDSIIYLIKNEFLRK